MQRDFVVMVIWNRDEWRDDITLYHASSPASMRIRLPFRNKPFSLHGKIPGIGPIVAGLIIPRRTDRRFHTKLTTDSALEWNGQPSGMLMVPMGRLG